jgi:translation initiation factor 1
MSIKPIFNNTDAFLDEAADDVFQDTKIHIRKQSRSGSKMITTIQNLDKSIDKLELLKRFRKQFACNGNIATDEEYGEVIQLQGDHARNICKFLREHNYAKEDQIMVH